MESGMGLRLKNTKLRVLGWPLALTCWAKNVDLLCVALGYPQAPICLQNVLWRFGNNDRELPLGSARTWRLAESYEAT